MQKEPGKTREQGSELLTIGYLIYQLSDKDIDGPQDINFFKKHASIARSSSFLNMREVTGRHKLNPGKYLIVPSTFDPNLESEFVLRIYSEKSQQAAYEKFP